MNEPTKKNVNEPAEKNLTYLIYAILALIAYLSAVCVFYMDLIADVYKYLLIGAIILSYILCVVFKLIKKEPFFRLFVFILAFTLFFAALFLLLDKSNFWDYLSSMEKLQAFIKEQGIYSPIVFVLIQFLQVVAIPIPGMVTSAVGVVLFGPVLGSVLGYLGIVLGSITAFAIGRKFGYKLVVWIFGEKSLEKILKLIKGRDKVIFTMMFLLPFFPDDMLCFVAGLTAMSFTFFTGMVLVVRIITILATTFTTSIAQSLLQTGQAWGYTLFALLCVAILAVFLLSLKYGDKIQAFYEEKFEKKSRK